MIASFLPFARAAVIALAAGASALEAPETRWQEDIKATEAAYATNRFAILKIDDAVYLNPGETAWLVAKPDGGSAWRLEKAAPAIATATYAGGQITLAAGAKRVTFAAEAGGEISVDGARDVRAQMTQIAPGRMGVRLFAYNQANPAAKAFTGLSYFPYAPSYVVTAAFHAEPAQPMDFQTSRGWWKRFWRVGYAEFDLNGAHVKLPLYSGDAEGSDGLSAFFLDKTTGEESYDTGRYLDADADGPFPPKTVTLDFNYAYNPNCARTPHYNCPFARDVIATAVRAGEMAPGDH
ncbi:MAG: DUF1684 domain-containing protein [Hyphomonadaceae bacterium]